MKHGCVVEESDDAYPLACFSVTDPENEAAVNQEAIARLWQQTRSNLDRFPGRTRKVDGRQYLNWEDYRGWRGRRVKVDLRAGISPGLIVCRWNQRIEEQGGGEQATLAGILGGVVKII